jgi:hypothetical protein
VTTFKEKKKKKKKKKKKNCFNLGDIYIWMDAGVG